jgi:hypothetical protein
MLQVLGICSGFSHELKALHGSCIDNKCVLLMPTCSFMAATMQ